MKYTISIFVLAGLLFIGCKDNKQKEETPATQEEASHNWSERQMAAFTANCNGFLENEGVGDSTTYCDCLLETSINKYPDVEKAMELEQHQIVKMLEDSGCIDNLVLLKIEHPWTEEAETLFLKNCNQGKIDAGMAEDAAAEYCNCALDKVREIIPNPEHVISLTQEELDGVLEACGQ